MAPGRAGSDASTSPSATAPPVGSAASPGSGRPGPGLGAVLGRRHPSALHMVLEALRAGEQRRGTSVAAIKIYVLQKYPTVDVARFKLQLKQALATGVRRGLLTRPINSKARGATGSFKLVPKQKRPRSQRKPTLTAPRRARGASGKDPPKPGQVEKGPTSSAAEKKGAWGAAVTVRKVPLIGSQAEDMARQDAPKSGKGPRAPGPSGKHKAPGSRGPGGDVEAHREMAVQSKGPKCTAAKVGGRGTFPSRRKPSAKAPPDPGPKAAAPVQGGRRSRGPRLRGRKAAGS